MSLSRPPMSFTLVKPAFSRSDLAWAERLPLRQYTAIVASFSMLGNLPASISASGQLSANWACPAAYSSVVRTSYKWVPAARVTGVGLGEDEPVVRDGLADAHSTRPIIIAMPMMIAMIVRLLTPLSLSYDNYFTIYTILQYSI